MPHRLLAHIVWTPRDRAPLIEAERARFLQLFLFAVAAEERAQILALGMVSTHVHMLAALNVSADIPRLIQRFKGGSARVATRDHIGPRQRPLRWAKGYDLRSVTLRNAEMAADYVEAQSMHHPDEAIAGWAQFRAADLGAALARPAQRSLSTGELPVYRRQPSPKGLPRFARSPRLQSEARDRPPRSPRLREGQGARRDNSIPFRPAPSPSLCSWLRLRSGRPTLEDQLPRSARDDVETLDHP